MLGNRVRRVKRLYPRAPRIGRSYRIVSGRNIFGSGRGRYTVVGARVKQRRVRSFFLRVGAAGE